MWVFGECEGEYPFVRGFRPTPFIFGRYLEGVNFLWMLAAGRLDILAVLISWIFPVDKGILRGLHLAL